MRKHHNINIGERTAERIKIEVGAAIIELENQLSDKNVYLEVTDELIDWIVENGYDSKMGARPVGRLIDEKIRKPLATEILFGKLESGGKVTAKLVKNDIKFSFSAKKVEEIS